MLMWDGSSTGGTHSVLCPTWDCILARLPALRLLPKDTLQVTQHMGAVSDLWDTPEDLFSLPELFKTLLALCEELSSSHMREQICVRRGGRSCAGQGKASLQ